jgi:hypothetical protein
VEGESNLWNSETKGWDSRGCDRGPTGFLLLVVTGFEDLLCVGTSNLCSGSYDYRDK